MPIRALRTLALLLVLTASAGAQTTSGALPTQDDLARRLAGDWIKAREAVFTGGGRCRQGERWRFLADGTLVVRRCVNEAWRVTRHRWHLEPDGQIDFRLGVMPALPETGRRVLFRSGQLVLRQMPASRTIAVEDVVLRTAAGRPPPM